MVKHWCLPLDITLVSAIRHNINMFCLFVNMHCWTKGGWERGGECGKGRDVVFGRVKISKCCMMHVGNESIFGSVVVS